MVLSEREQQFLEKNKIPLQEAIDKLNKKKNEQIDYSFLVQMYDDETYRDICEHQISLIENQLCDIMLARDNFTSRIVERTIKEYDTPKRESDDTRIARKIINKELVISSMLSSPYKINPIIQLNPQLYGKEDIPLVFDVSSEFIKLNEEYIIKHYYEGTRRIKGYSIRNQESIQYLNITRDMIKDVDLRKYPFYIRREIQNANRNILSVC